VGGLRFWFGFLCLLSHKILNNPPYTDRAQIMDLREALYLCDIDMKSVFVIFWLKHICGSETLYSSTVYELLHCFHGYLQAQVASLKLKLKFPNNTTTRHFHTQPADLLRTWRNLLISDMAEQFWLALNRVTLQSC